MTDTATARPSGRIHLALGTEAENSITLIREHYKKDGICLSASAVIRLAVRRLASRLPGV